MNWTWISAAIVTSTLSFASNASAQQQQQPQPVTVDPDSQFSLVTIEGTERAAFLEREDGVAISTTIVTSRAAVASNQSMEPVWTRVCYAPCSALLHRAAFYRINDESPSLPFTLTPGSMRLTVHHGSPAGLYLGATTFILGLVAATTIASVAPVMLLRSGEFDLPLEGGIYAASAAVSAAMIVGGWIWWRGSMASVRDRVSGRRVANRRPAAIQWTHRGIEF